MTSMYLNKNFTDDLTDQIASELEFNLTSTTDLNENEVFFECNSALKSLRIGLTAFTVLCIFIGSIAGNLFCLSRLLQETIFIDYFKPVHIKFDFLQHSEHPFCDALRLCNNGDRRLDLQGDLVPVNWFSYERYLCCKHTDFGGHLN